MIGPTMAISANSARMTSPTMIFGDRGIRSTRERVSAAADAGAAPGVPVRVGAIVIRVRPPDGLGGR